MAFYHCPHTFPLSSGMPTTFIFACVLWFPLLSLPKDGNAPGHHVQTHALYPVTLFGYASQINFISSHVKHSPCQTFFYLLQSQFILLLYGRPALHPREELLAPCMTITIFLLPFLMSPQISLPCHC